MSTPSTYITDPIWGVWLGANEAIRSARLGGIYANKPGYHNTREANERHWPGNYSIELPLDKQGPDDKAAALDLTLSDADMRKYTDRLRDAMEAGDNRLGSVKEFYGTLDGRRVFGLGKKSRKGRPYRTSADSSHLWHIHISFFRADVEHRDRILGVLEVLTGATDPKPSTPNTPNAPTPSTGGTDWTQEAIMSMPTLKQGSRGRDVGRLQALLAANGYPPRNSFNSKGEPDNIFGDGTGDALEELQEDKNVRNSVRNGKGDRICGRYSWTELLGA